MKRHLTFFAATALFSTFATAQVSDIPDPTDPASAPASEDRTSGGTRDTTPGPRTSTGTTTSTTSTTKSKAGFNALESAGGTLSDKDASFVKKVASIGLEEVEAGKTAADAASDTKVKEFAQQMVTDHSANNDELKAVVEKKGITLPTEPQGGQADALAKLKAKKGDAFDQAYVADQVKGHREAIRLVSNAAKNAKDPEVKAFAEKTLPTLKHHLEMAESLEKAIKPTRPMSKSKKEPVPATDTSS